MSETRLPESSLPDGIEQVQKIEGKDVSDINIRWVIPTYQAVKEGTKDKLTIYLQENILRHKCEWKEDDAYWAAFGFQEYFTNAYLHGNLGLHAGDEEGSGLGIEAFIKMKADLPENRNKKITVNILITNKSRLVIEIQDERKLEAVAPPAEVEMPEVRAYDPRDEENKLKPSGRGKFYTVMFGNEVIIEEEKKQVTIIRDIEHPTIQTEYDS